MAGSTYRGVPQHPKGGKRGRSVRLPKAHFSGFPSPPCSVLPGALGANQKNTPNPLSSLKNFAPGRTGSKPILTGSTGSKLAKNSLFLELSGYFSGNRHARRTPRRMSPPWRTAPQFAKVFAFHRARGWRGRGGRITRVGFVARSTYRGVPHRCRAGAAPSLHWWTRIPALVPRKGKPRTPAHRRAARGWSPAQASRSKMAGVMW